MKEQGCPVSHKNVPAPKSKRTEVDRAFFDVMDDTACYSNKKQTRGYETKHLATTDVILKGLFSERRRKR